MFLCNLTSNHNSETLRANFCYGNMSVSLTERKLSFPYLVIDLIFKGVMNLIIFSPFTVVFLWLLAAAVDNGNSTGLTAWSIQGYYENDSFICTMRSEGGRVLSFLFLCLMIFCLSLPQLGSRSLFGRTDLCRSPNWFPPCLDLAAVARRNGKELRVWGIALFLLMRCNRNESSPGAPGRRFVGTRILQPTT